jgi:hypothetical protein
MKTLLIKKGQLMMITLFLGVTSFFAQTAEAPDYNFELGAKINDMTITQGGTVVVATNDGLVGIKPGQNELLFNFTDYGRVKPEELKYVPLSPYVVVGQTGFGGLQTKSAVIDYMSGKTLFSTENNGWKGIGMSEVIMPQNILVVSGQRKASEKYVQAVALYDLSTGEEVSMYKFKGSRQVMGKPLVLKDGIIIPTTKGLMKVDMNSGNVLWENELKYIGWMVASEDEKDIYAFASTANRKNTKIYKIGSNGQSTWADERKVKGNVTNFQILPQGLAVVSDVAGGSGTFAAKSESKIALLNASNGEDLWEKAPKTKGYVQHFYIMDDGILFGIGSGGINKISFDGKPLFKKPLKTGENILTMAETPQGLIYITSEDANIVNLETGEQVWSKPLKFKRATTVSSTFDSKNNRYLIAADEKIFAIDASSGNSELLTESKFEGKEDPTSIEVRDNGILLTSDQNMMMLDWQGETNWHEYHRAPGKSAFGAILAGVTAVASTAVAMDAAARAGANRNYLGQYNQYGARMKRTSDAFAAIGSASFAEMAKRFKATSATQDAQYVLTKLDDGVGLVKLNKDTGAIEKEIILKDKKPEYKVDEFGGYMYYKLNDKTIYAYNLNQ